MAKKTQSNGTSNGASKPKNFTRNNKRGRSSKGKGTVKEAENKYNNSTPTKGDMPHNTAAMCIDNDPSWYTHIYPLVQDVANFNYNIPVGTPFNPLTGKECFVSNAGTVSAIPNRSEGKIVPGIMTFEVAPSIGYSNDPTSAPNIAAQQLYSLVRKANSGAVNYDKTDLMMMIVAMDSAYMLYEELLRAYRLIGRYEVDSRYMPDALLYALKFAPDLQKDLANFRGLLDTFAYKFSAINVPDQFDFIRRHSWLFTNVYTDSESSKAQLYAYVPDGYYVWTEGTSDRPTYLRYVSRGELFGQSDYVKSLDNMYKAMNTIMEPLLGSQDIGVMSGDVAKAFGEAGMIAVKPAEQYETLTPVYSMEVIQQMMNSTIISSSLAAADITVNYDSTTSGPFLVYTPKFDKSKDNIGHGLHKHLINLKQAGGVDINMVATRNVCNIDWSSHDSMAAIVSCGTEIVTSATIHYMQSKGNHLSSTRPISDTFYQNMMLPIYNIGAVHNMPENDLETLKNNINQLANMSAFDNCPTVYLFATEVWNQASANLAKYLGTVQDIDNYTWLDEQTIKQLNDAALLSLFYVQSWPSI